MSFGVEKTVSLRNYNALALDATADYFCRLGSLDDVHQALAFARANKLTITALGGGSNVVLKNTIHGLVALVELRGIRHRCVGDDVYVTIGAGEDWSSLVALSLRNHWYGLENLALIPGSVGAAPIQNIGAYGVELCDCFVSLQAIHTATGELHEMDAKDCEFGYRESIFKRRERNNYVITEVCIKLSTQPNNRWHYPALRDALEAKLEAKLGEASAVQVTPQLIAETVADIRRTKLPDPARLPNAGSFFKNPLLDQQQLARLMVDEPQIPVYPAYNNLSKVPAAWLIERCGLRGYRAGEVGVHERQALVLINYGSGSAAELLALCEHIQSAVEQRFGVCLEVEPRIYGSF